MTLPLSGPLVLGSGGNLTTEFGLAANAVFPTAYYSKGGAPASGPLSMTDFYGRSNTATATVTPDPVNGNVAASPSNFGPTATCAVVGGVGPFTYAYSRVTGDVTITAVTPALASTDFNVTAIGPGGFKTSTWRCAVTDTGNGNVVYLSNIFTVDVTRA